MNEEMRKITLQLEEVIQRLDGLADYLYHKLGKREDDI